MDDGRCAYRLEATVYGLWSIVRAIARLFRLASAAEDEFTHRAFGHVVKAGDGREKLRVAPAQRTGREIHGRGDQIHRLIEHTHMLQDQGVGHRLVLPGYAGEAGGDDEQDLGPGLAGQGEPGL